MTSRREEAAIDLMGAIAPVVGLLPDAVLEAMSGAVIASDVQASNVPVYAGDTYIAGAKVLRQYGIGPLPGVAMMVVLVSRGASPRSPPATTAHRSPTRTCSRDACARVSTRCSRWPVIHRRAWCPHRSPDPKNDSPPQPSPNGSVAY